MRSHAVFSVAFIAAAVAPVMSVPVAGSQSTQPAPTALALNQNQTAQVPPAPANLVDEFLSSLSPGQLQDLTAIVQAAVNSSDPTSSYANKVNVTTDGCRSCSSSTPSQPEKRAGFGTLFSGAVEPTPTAKADYMQDELERRQLGDLIDILEEGAAKVGLKVGEKVAESAIKSSVKRTAAPIPNAKRHWTPPAIPTPPPIPSCWRTESCD
ncbi:hypothetical protein JVT61DRAFT_1225 [Boletus reticuloceps]|uniref:Uncharacterized protein n=1 Tax=Boletus reticuloceps TaxID=495285 RepID=A0A8I2YUE2_9AGAM|nr:hypothetical protein JVT61DRAFT_1225 [Boletus reticuloceps]